MLYSILFSIFIIISINLILFSSSIKYQKEQEQGVQRALIGLAYRYRKEIPDFLYRALCNGVVSHGAPVGGYSGFCHPHTQKQTKYVHHLLVLCSILCVFISLLSSRSDRSTYAPDESRLIWSCEYPQLEPHAGIKKVQVLGSPVYICGLGRYKIWKRCWLHSYKVLSQRSKSKSVKQSGSKTMFSQGAPV